MQVVGGEDEDIAETQAFLGQSFIISLVLMVIILMVQFNSGWQAFVTMSAIVLSTGGVVLESVVQVSIWHRYVALVSFRLPALS